MCLVVFAGSSHARAVWLELYRLGKQRAPSCFNRIDASLIVGRRKLTLLSFTVLDEGPGIPEDEHEQVFELFYRGSDGPQTSGLGIGLAVVRELTERMGGSVAVANRKEGGACFSVRLPLDLPGRQGLLPN